MSSIRLCLAGLLVAAGLILGGFTLHGYFDPQWEAKHSRTSDVRAAAPAKVVPAQHGRNRFVAREERSPAVPARMTAATPAVPSSPAKVAAPTQKSSAPRKKVADKPKQTPSEQQASFLWPWNPFSN